MSVSPGKYFTIGNAVTLNLISISAPENAGNLMQWLLVPIQFRGN
jgi:hypothetical protein